MKSKDKDGAAFETKEAKLRLAEANFRQAALELTSAYSSILGLGGEQSSELQEQIFRSLEQMFTTLPKTNTVTTISDTGKMTLGQDDVIALENNLRQKPN